MERQRQIEVMRQCRDLSLSGEIAFPEVVRRLHEAGVERYHVDFSRDETTYYLPNGESHVFGSEEPPGDVGEVFDGDAVADAVRKIQSGEIDYRGFVRQIMEAGCVGYFAQITGRRVMYFGRTGDEHVEHFPVP